MQALTFERFSETVHQTFRLEIDASVFELELIAVDAIESSGAPPDGRKPFSLVFRGPSEPVLPQRLYPLAHDRIGKAEIFLVPIGPDERGMRYEAVFY